MVANLESVFLNHPDAECIIVAKLNRLNFEELFGDADFQTETCKFTHPEMKILVVFRL